MSIERLQSMSTIFYIIAVVLLFIAIALFFLLDIRRIIGDLTGITARKAIEDIRRQNENTGEKNYKSSPVNVARGRLTDKISPSGKLIKSTGGIEISPQTEKFNTSELSSDTGNTEVLNTGMNETTVLSHSTNETTVLNKEFCIEFEIGYAESKEIIE